MMMPFDSGDGRCRAFSLIEVVIAVGIVAFSVVAIMGLIPVMLDVLRESREKAATARVYQAVAEDLWGTPPTTNETRGYQFDPDGLPLVAGRELRYEATSASVAASLPGASANTNLLLSQVTIVNRARQKTNLQRPVWVVRLRQQP